MTIHRVQCFVRIRPLLEEEEVTQGSEGECLSINTDEQRILLGHHQSYRFDRVFDPTIPLHHIRKTVVVGMVQEALKGFRKALLLYGPTGGGKSYTLNQLIPLSIQMLLQTAYAEALEYETTITMECVRIHLERISDLIDPSKNDLQLREFPDIGVYVRGATQLPIASLEDFDKVWNKIAASRSSPTTSLYGTVSRGHCVVSLRVKRRRKIDSNFEGASLLKDDNAFSSFITDGCIYFVDLAGSEQLRESVTNTMGQVTTIKTNQSVSVLCSVMNAMTDPKKTHIPSRDSKLTRLLQEPLGMGGSSDILVCISRSPIRIHDTGLALAFGVKAMSIVQESECKKSIDHTSYLADVQQWLSNRVHMLEGQLQLLSLNSTRQCKTCIEKEIKILEISQELSSLKTQTTHTVKEYNVTVSRLRDALEMTQNDCEYYRRKAIKKLTIIDEVSQQRKLHALNEYWTGYAEALQKDLEITERERDEACTELSNLSTAITELRLQQTKSPEAQQTTIENNAYQNDEFPCVNIDQRTTEGKTFVELTTRTRQNEKGANHTRTKNWITTRDCTTLRAELDDAQRRAGDRRKTGHCISSSVHCSTIVDQMSGVNGLFSRVGTEKEYYCCWRRMLRSAVDECEASWHSPGKSSTNNLSNGESPSINLSKFERHEISSSDTTLVVVKDLVALF